MGLRGIAISQVVDHGLMCYVNQSGHGPWTYVLRQSVRSWTMGLRVAFISRVVDHGLKPMCYINQSGRGPWT